MVAVVTHLNLDAEFALGTITPNKISIARATDAQLGIVRLANNTEVANGIADDVAITPADLVTALASRIVGCDGSPVTPLDRVVTTPVGVYGDGNVCRHDSLNGCIELVDIYAATTTNSVAVSNAFGGNVASGSYSSVLAGAQNTIEGVHSAVLCGQFNNIASTAGSAGVVGAGNDVAGALAKFVAGLQNVTLDNTFVAILLGQENRSLADVSPVTTGAFAIGYNNNLHGGGVCGAIGATNNVTGDGAIAIGTNITNTTPYSVVVQGAGYNVGFFGVPPVPRQNVNAAATDLPTVIALCNSIRSGLIALGLVA